MSSSLSTYNDQQLGPKVLRGANVSSSTAVLGEQLQDCAPGDPNAVDPRLRERSLREGHQQGFDLGYKEGLDAARAELDQTRRNLQNAISALQLAAAEYKTREIDALRESEQQVLDAVFEIAHAVLQREVSLDNDNVREGLRRALALAPNGNEATAYLHPDDAGQLESTQIEVDGRLIRVIPNVQIERGGCVLQVGASEIDSQLHTALARIREALQ